MANEIGWGKGVNNDIGWGAYPVNDIGAGSIYAVSIFGETLGIGDSAAEEFIISVKTDNVGTSTDVQFTLPMLLGTYDVDWGDSNIDLSQVGAKTHTYSISGTYEIKVTGGTHIKFDNGGDRLKLLDISNWGVNVWTTMDSAFQGCATLTSLSATDSPDLSSVTTMIEMFRSCSLLNSDFSSWDVSNVQSFERTLSNCSAYNESLNNWNMSSATTIKQMFNSCAAFNQDLNSWDVSGVTDFSNLFYDCGNFNGNVSSWVTTAATLMPYVFYQCDSFNQSINGWDFNGVTNASFMLRTCGVYNQPMNSIDTSTITNMSNFMYNCDAFDQDISSWDINQVSTFTNFLTQANGLSTSNYDALLIAWDAQGAMSYSGTVDFGLNTKYTSGGAAETARTSLISKWGAIVDGGAA